MDKREMDEMYQFRRQVFLDMQESLANNPNALTCCWCGKKFTMGQGSAAFPYGPQTHCESKEHKICPLCANEIKIEYTAHIGFFNDKLQKSLVKGIYEADYETKKKIADELSKIGVHLKAISNAID